MGTRHRSEHAWFTVEFSYAGWVECECGYKPNSQKEMDAHIPPTGAVRWLHERARQVREGEA